MEQTAAATAIALPDDAVREILIRVADDAAFFRCATTCKRWRALVAERSFLLRRWPEDSPGSSSLFGFFVPRWRRGEPAFVPAPRSPIDVSCCCNSSFFPNPAGLLKGAEPVAASRHGLLLARLRHNVSASAIHLAVCNPLSGTCDVLPPLTPGASFHTLCHAVLTSADCCTRGQQSPMPGCSAFFKVVIIGRYIDILSPYDDLHILSFDGSRWTATRECFVNQPYIWNTGMQSSAVVCRGTAYWLFRSRSNYCTLEVRTDTGHVTLVKLVSVQLDYHNDIPPCLGIGTDGTLSVFRLRRECDQVEKWTCQGGDSSAEWICSRVIEVEPPKRDDRALSIYVCERSDTLLLRNSGVHITDLETGRTEDITAQFRCLVHSVCVPYEVDWAAFFLYRLGGRH